MNFLPSAEGKIVIVPTESLVYHHLGRVCFCEQAAASRYCTYSSTSFERHLLFASSLFRRSISSRS